MPLITLSDAVDVKLRLLLTDFGQTRESILVDLIDSELARRNTPGGNRAVATAVAVAAASTTRRLSPENPGSLRHTRVLAATIGTTELSRPKWTGVREYLHVLAMGHFGSWEQVQAAGGANIRAGRFEEDGYKFIPQVGFSIQGVDSHMAWDQSLRLARALTVPLSLTVQWRNKEGSAHPGETAILAWQPALS